MGIGTVHLEALEWEGACVFKGEKGSWCDCHEGS